MKQYIEKSDIVAKIEEWRNNIKKNILSIPLSGKDKAYATYEYEVLGKVIIFLDILEVKEVDENKSPLLIDAFIKKAKKWFNCKNGIIITDTKAFFEEFIDYMGIE